LEVIDILVVKAQFKIHKVKRQWGFGQSLANVELIAGCMSQILKLTFDNIRVYGVMEVAQDNSVGSFAPRLIIMVDDVVCVESFNQPTVGIRIGNIDFDRFVSKRFAVVLFLLMSGRELGRHVLIIGHAIHIYGRRLVFPRLLGAGSTRRSREIFVRPTHINLREVRMFVKPVPRGEWGRRCRLRRFRRQMGPLPFLDSLPGLVGRSRGSKAQGSI